jgi:MSHA biogenesis protein MshL
MFALTNAKKIFVAGATAALLGACASLPSPAWRDDVRGSIDQNLKDAQGTTGKALPGDVKDALLPPIEINLPDGKTTPLEPRFDLTVANAQARQVFLGIVEGTPYSMVLHPDVRGVLTLNLKEVTVPEAMSAIRHGYGYEFKRDGNRFFVYGRDMQTRLFQVNYLNLIRKGKSDTRVSGTGEIGRTTSSGGGTTTSSSSSGSTGTSSVSGAEVETQSQSDFWKELTDSLKAIVGEANGRKVVVSREAGLVIVRAMPEELRVVEELLGATHANIGRQVMLEAKIIEVELNDRFQAGINWAAVGTAGNTGLTAAQIGGGSSNLSTTGATDIAGGLASLRPGSGTFNPTGGTLTSAFGGVFTLAAMGADFTAFLELLKAQGEVQVLSSPRVSTVNNQKAVIKVGGDEFFVTGATTAVQATVNTGGTPASVTLSSFFSGIVLDVTPQIDEANNIILHIHPSVGNVTEKTKSFSISGEAFTLPLALSTIQESDNVVRAQSGQVIVIGGLMKEGSTDENSSVPFLGDIPIIGALFKHKKVTRIKKELVILLKPTVMQSAQDFGDSLRDSTERVKKIKIGS